MKENILDIDMALGQDGKLHTDVGGAASPFVAPFVHALVKTLNGLKVIAKRDGANVYNLYNPPQPTKAGFRALTRKLKELTFGHVFPATANIAITSACQCRCAHCSADLFQCGGSGRRDMTTPEIKRVIDEALDLGANIIILTGGEPLLHRELADLVRYVDKDKAVVMLFSNGEKITPEAARELAAAGLYSLNISVDDADPATHDRLRGREGLHDMAFQALHNARDAGILAGISTYGTHENIASGRLEALLTRCQEEGANEVTIFDCIPSGRLLWDRDGVLSDPEKQKIVDIGKSFHDSDHPMGVVVMAQVNSPAGAGCFGGFSQVYVTCHGDVNPCDFNPISFGSVREMPLQAIWEKMVTHPEFGRRQMTCRMQSPRYRHRYIEPIPHDLEFPVPIEALPGDGRFLRDVYEAFLSRMKNL